MFNKKLFILTLIASFSSMIALAAHATKKPQIILRTIPEAITLIHKAINQYPTKPAAVPTYEKDWSPILVRCGKILYDTARDQLLQALSEIDNRINYWQYQKDHPWNYFVSKNPMKWISGPKQEDEIETNLDTLKSHQGELYVLLGQLSELGTAFTQGYKDTFLSDYTKGYAWLDALLSALIRIPSEVQVASNVPFIMRAHQLEERLNYVTKFKNIVLADIAETEMPSYLERSWFKSGLALLGLNYAYRNITATQIQTSLATVQQGFTTVMDPVVATLKDILTPGWQKEQWQSKGEQLSSDQEYILPTVGQSYETKLELAKEFIKQMGDKYQLQADAKNALAGLDKGNLSPYEKFVENVGNKESLQLSLFKPFTSAASSGEWLQNLKDYGRGLILAGKLEVIGYVSDVEKAALAREKEGKKFFLEQQKKYEEYALEKEKQYSAVGKVVLLIPAVLAVGGMYAGYQKLTEKNYNPLRKALVDINSLFVDPSKPLDDEQYGKMIYLIYMLKKRAQKELPVKKNLQADFIADLERIESQEYNVAAKRAIIEDMFKKYTFLGLIQKK